MYIHSSEYPPTLSHHKEKRESGGTNIHSKSVYQRFFSENAQWHFIQKNPSSADLRKGDGLGPFPRNILVYLPPSLAICRLFSLKHESLRILQL